VGVWSEGATGGVDSAADDHPTELVDVACGVLPFEEGLEVPDEGAEDGFVGGRWTVRS
jgi:hypothetical protein